MAVKNTTQKFTPGQAESILVVLLLAILAATWYSQPTHQIAGRLPQPPVPLRTPPASPGILTGQGVDLPFGELVGDEKTGVKVPVPGPGRYAIPLATLADWMPATEDTGFRITGPGSNQTELEAWIEPGGLNGEPALFFDLPDPCAACEQLKRYTTELYVIITGEPGQPGNPPSLYSPPNAAHLGEMAEGQRGSASGYWEQNLFYDPLAPLSPGWEAAGSPPPWFWERLVAPARLELALDADPSTLPAAGLPAVLQVRLWSKTVLVRPLELGAALNGVDLLTVRSLAPLGMTLTDTVPTGWFTLEYNLPAGVLQPGKNTLVLNLPADPEERVVIVALDGVAIARTGVSASLDSHFRVLDSSLPAAEQPTAALLPRVSSPVSPSLSGEGWGVRWLAIGPADLLSPLQPLLDLRTAQGLPAAAIPVELIYDQLGGGSPSPFAIQAFLHEAARAWETPPRFVLLVGDWTYDPLNYLPESAAHNRLPSFFTLTLHGGETVTDLPYALGPDGLPELAVGRLPAASADQVAAYVAKVLRYEKVGAVRELPLPAPGQNRILALADNFDVSFEGDARHFLDRFSSSPRFTSLLFAPPVEGNPSEQPGGTGETEISTLRPPAETVSQEIRRQLETGGAFLFAYFGHGSLRQLGKAALFTNEDAAQLRNLERLPVVLNVTCLAGLFTHPRQDSLAETLLFNPNGGAIATLSASSLTTPLEQTILTQAIADQLNAPDPPATWGEVVLQAQRQALGSVQEVVETFLLFGDPALTLPGNQVSR